MKTFFVIIISMVLMEGCQPSTTHEQLTHETKIQYYTCSMDPQVIETKPGKCPICKMDLTPISADQLHSNGIKLSDQQIQLANIKTQKVEYRFDEYTLASNGTVTEDQNATSNISARFPGRIEKLYFKKNGMFIKKGDVLAKMYSEILNSTQAELIEAYQKLDKNSSDALSRSLVEASIHKLLLWGIEPSQIEEIKKSAQPISPFPIKSMITGNISKLMITEGAEVTSGETLFEVSNFQTMWVEAELYPSEINKLNVNQLVDLEIEGAFSSVQSGKIIQLIPQVSSNSLTTLVRILFKPNSPYIRPGMQAYIYWHSSDEKSLMVPLSAIFEDQNGQWVWVLNKGGIFETRMIHINKKSGKYASIHHGLTENDEVVISGGYLLQSEFVFKKGINPMAGHDM